MQSIESLLKGLQKLEPVPTTEQARYSRDDELRAVVFDIYGTLMISASGDVDEAQLKSDHLLHALQNAHIWINVINYMRKKDLLDNMLLEFRGMVVDFHKCQRERGVSYPEIDVLALWARVLDKVDKMGFISMDGLTEIRRMTFEFELYSNPVYPMPGMHDIILELSKRKVPLGIVSNAQFYTPQIMNFFLSGRYRQVLEIDYFDPALTVYSFRMMKAKPDESLYRYLLLPLKERYGLKPSQVLYVGNDMLKDIWPAGRVGFKTALFAGDKRSLRLRRDQPVVKNVVPDFVITHLNQIKEILPL